MSAGKYVAIWQDRTSMENAWLQEVFGGFISRSITDGKREVVGDGVILFDYHVTGWRDSYHARFRGRDAILVDLSDEFYDFDPEIYANFRGVIRTYWSDVFRPGHVLFLPLGYGWNPAKSEGGPRPALRREYAWSFLGQVNKSSRVEMVRELGRVEPHLLFATDDVPGITMWNRSESGRRRYTAAESAGILGNTIFAPCPMGNVNLECYRVYEALEQGTIPIVEKRSGLDYFRNLWGEHPVPAFSTWKEARVWMRGILGRPAEIESLQGRCVEWWKEYKQRYVASVGEFLEERSASEGVASVEGIVFPKYSRRGWQLRELLRHHSAGALRRRATLQLTRMLKERRFRVAATAGPADAE